MNGNKIRIIDMISPMLFAPIFFRRGRRGGIGGPSSKPVEDTRTQWQKYLDEPIWRPSIFFFSFALASFIFLLVFEAAIRCLAVIGIETIEITNQWSIIILTGDYFIKFCALYSLLYLLFLIIGLILLPFAIRRKDKAIKAGDE